MKNLLVLLLLLLPGLTLAMGTPPQKPTAVATPGTPGVMLRNDALRASPGTAAASVVQLNRGDKVRVLTSDGGWTQVHASGKTGWVRILSVKSETATASDLGVLVETGKRPADAGKVVAVAGARGLDEVALKAARFDAEELARMDTYVADRADAEQFAQRAGLASRKIAYLPDPDHRATSTGNAP